VCVGTLVRYEHTARSPPTVMRSHVRAAFSSRLNIPK
jgi:hypothetical protein